MALRFEQAIRHSVLNRGFGFGHELLGHDRGEVVHFVFEFYEFAIYHALINPSNVLARAVLTAMGEGGDSFFFALDASNTVTAFRSERGEDNLPSWQGYLPRL